MFGPRARNREVKQLSYEGEFAISTPYARGLRELTMLIPPTMLSVYHLLIFSVSMSKKWGNHDFIGDRYLGTCLKKSSLCFFKCYHHNLPHIVIPVNCLKTFNYRFM